MSIEPNKDLLADERIPRITLAGQDWPIPRLAIAQNLEIFPLLAPRLDVFKEVVESKSVTPISTPVLNDLASAVYWALTRAHKITRAEFDDLPIAALEIWQAAAVVAEQSGLYKRAKPEQNGISPPLAETVAARLPTG